VKTTYWQPVADANAVDHDVLHDADDERGPLEGEAGQGLLPGANTVVGAPITLVALKAAEVVRLI
jgi:hypothetical protein